MAGIQAGTAVNIHVEERKNEQSKCKRNVGTCVGK